MSAAPVLHPQRLIFVSRRQGPEFIAEFIETLGRKVTSKTELLIIFNIWYRTQQARPQREWARITHEEFAYWCNCSRGGVVKAITRLKGIIGSDGRPAPLIEGQKVKRNNQYRCLPENFFRALDLPSPLERNKQQNRGRNHCRRLYPDPLGRCEHDTGCFERATDRHHRDRNAENNERSNVQFLCEKHHEDVHRKRKHQ